MTDDHKLAAIILVPLVLSTIIHSVLAYLNKPQRDNKWYHLALDETELSSQPLFWIALELPFFYFLSTGITVWLDCTLDISAKGFGVFIDISKLPLGILGLAIPLAVLVGRLHSTKQTARQLENTQVQLGFSKLKLKEESYNKAKDSFVDTLSSLFDFEVKAHMGSVHQLELDANALFYSIFKGSDMSTGINKPNFDQVDKAVKLMKDQSNKEHNIESSVVFLESVKSMYISWTVNENQLPWSKRVKRLIFCDKTMPEASRYTYSHLYHFCIHTIKSTANNVYDVNRLDRR